MSTRNRLISMASSFVLASAFSAAQTSEESSECQQYKMGVPAVQAVQRHNELRQNTDDDVAIVLYVPENDNGCCFLTNDPNQPGIYPTKFELQPTPGFRVRVKSGLRYRARQPGTSIELATGQKLVLLKLRANRGTPVGKYVLRGKLTYQTTQDHKSQSSRELEVTLPIEVVTEHSKVGEVVWPYGTHVKKTLLTIIALPVEIPAAVLLAIACSRGCDL